MSSTNLVAIVGSLRAESFNRAVFYAVTDLVADDVTLAEVPIADVPFYDGDVEAAGDPAAVVAMRSAVEAADGLILFTPEYNRGVPAVMKNAIDWLSRLPGDSALSRSTVGVIAASPGRGDAAGVRAHMADSLGGTSGHLHKTMLGIAGIGAKLTDGRLTDDETRAALVEWLDGFVGFVQEQS